MLLLAACGSGTAAEPTPTPEPTPVPTPEPTPELLYTSLEIVTAFADNLDYVGNVVDYTEETDPNELLGRQGGYNSKTDFHDNRISNNCTVEAYGDAEAAARRYTYLQAFQGTPFGDYWLYQYHAAVVRFSNELNSAQIEEYLAVLNELYPDGPIK